MKRYSLLLVLGMSFSPLISNGQGVDLSKPQRILFLLNASSSMNEPWVGGISRFQAAERFILTVMDSLNIINKDVEFGLRVFGDQYPALENNCYDSHLEVKFSKDNRVQMGLRLEHIKPQGISSIAYAIHESQQNDIERTDQVDYQVILITDSPESCSKDFCPQARLLIEKTIITPYTINLGNNSSLREVYACVGRYLPMTNGHSLEVAEEEILKQYIRKPHVSAAGDGYLKVRNINQITVVSILLRIDNSFSTTRQSTELITELAKGPIKIKAGEYRIIYKTESSGSQSKAFVVKDGMVTEVLLD